MSSELQTAMYRASGYLWSIGSTWNVHQAGKLEGLSSLLTYGVTNHLLLRISEQVIEICNAIDAAYRQSDISHLILVASKIIEENTRNNPR